MTVLTNLRFALAAADRLPRRLDGLRCTEKSLRQA
jgi:hypothetical protein